jgi:serine/threonine protein kinase
MSPQEWQRAKAVLSVAAGLAGHEGIRFVEAEFPDQPTLRREVLDILRAQDHITRALGPLQVASLSASLTAESPGTVGPRADEPTLEIGGRYGPYQVVRALGAGGMGQVFLAEDVRLGRQVALKSLAGRWLASPTARQRLLREARAVAVLSHPHIATLYDVLDDERHLLLVMEYVEGRTAAALVADGPLPLGHALRLALQVTDAVVYAHDRGITHCDLKPLNVQVSLDGQAKVLDFGLAHAARDSYESSPDVETRSVTLVGTLPYMPPERLLTGVLNASGDVYSLGVTLFELVTARRPFEERDFASLTGAILGTTPPAASSFVPDCPASLDRLIARAMERDAKRRYHSVREMARDLRIVLGEIETATVPVVAPTDSPIAGGGSTAVREGAGFHTPMWLRPLLRGVGLAAAAVVSLTILGLVISHTFNLTFGLSGPFAYEAPQRLFVWGLRSLFTPTLYITAIVVAALAIRFAVRVLSLLGPIGRALRAGGRILSLMRARLSLDDPVVFGQLLVTLAVVAFGAVLWHFGDLAAAVFSYVNDADTDRLVLLGPGDEFSQRRSWYRFAFDVLILVFGLGAFRVSRLRREHQTRDGAVIQGVLVTTVVVFVLLNVAPLRVFFHQEDFEAVDVSGTRCYIIRELEQEMQLYCPRVDPPRNRILQRGDPSVRRLGITENVFKSIMPGADPR